MREAGEFVGDCDHVQVSDSAWHRAGARPGSGPDPAGPERRSPIPTATFDALAVAAGGSVMLQIALSVGRDEAAAAAAEGAFAKDEATFAKAWAGACSGGPVGSVECVREPCILKVAMEYGRLMAPVYL